MNAWKITVFARERVRLFRVAHALTGSRSRAELCVRLARASLPRMAATQSALQAALTELVARTALALAHDARRADPAAGSVSARARTAPAHAGDRSASDLEALTLALALVQEELRLTQHASSLLCHWLAAATPSADAQARSRPSQARADRNVSSAHALDRDMA
jgi:hypothetical protein